MANIFLGTGINFGVAGLSASINAVGTFKLQDVDHAKKAKVQDVQDGDGRTVQRTVYDESQEATLEYIISASTTAGAISATTLPEIGYIGTITDAADAAITATSWIVADVSKKRSNTSAARVTLKLERFPGITAVAG